MRPSAEKGAGGGNDNRKRVQCHVDTGTLMLLNLMLFKLQ